MFFFYEFKSARGFKKKNLVFANFKVPDEHREIY